MGYLAAILLTLDVYHPLSGEAGTPDAIATHPDGSTLVRLNDHWFFSTDLVVVSP